MQEVWGQVGGYMFMAFGSAAVAAVTRARWSRGEAGEVKLTDRLGVWLMIATAIVCVALALAVLARGAPAGATVLRFGPEPLSR